VLLYNTQDVPAIFTVGTDPDLQQIFLYTKNAGGQWDKELVHTFTNEGYIYELSAERDSNDSVHLLVLNISRPRTDPWYAHENSRLFYMTNKNGPWEKDPIARYDTLILNEEDVLVTRRQDLAIDSLNRAHVAYGIRISKGRSHMGYATNSSGAWHTEIALVPTDDSCDAGWDPSIAVNSDNVPVITSTFIERVPTFSAQYAQLRYSTRKPSGEWGSIVLMAAEDGYVGSDGVGYTGAISHLVVDNSNHPHIIYADIASSHDEQGNYFHVGQIRYLHFTGSEWEGTTLYRQTSSKEFNVRDEIHGFCLLLGPDVNAFSVIAQKFLNTKNDPLYHLLHLRTTR
jgi:hypothetical protein